MEVQLRNFNNDWYKPGNELKIALWYIFNQCFINSYLLPISSFKRSLLRLFGAKIGKGVIIKPKVNIKYPWKLEVGDYSWIGEKVWIDNLAKVTVGKNVCISQGALLLCGNHDYSISSFDLIVKEIILEDGVWIGAQAFVAPGIRCKSHAVLSASSFAKENLESYTIYAGNPAKAIKQRVINN